MWGFLSCSMVSTGETFLGKLRTCSLQHIFVITRRNGETIFFCSLGEVDSQVIGIIAETLCWNNEITVL
jgi:hypothetical protein